MDEEKDWAVDVEDMRKRVREAHGHCQPRILAIINPGNPTGERVTLYSGTSDKGISDIGTTYVGTSLQGTKLLTLVRRFHCIDRPT